MKTKFNKKILIVSVFILLISIAQVANVSYQNNFGKSPVEKIKTEVSPGVVKINAPAVDSQGNGIATTLKVEVVPGEGRVLTNINQLLFWVDTQHSIQTAESVARNFTNADLSKVDLIYTIETNASLIEGPSAGAALTIATIAAIENKTVNPHIAITGTIRPDGTIGPVGGILEKAKASKESGATLFLVPKGQGLQKTLTPVKKCEKVGTFTFCTTTYKESEVNVISEGGITIVEVATIEDALKYFAL